jgi:glycosyltransferase involved in cell wall biosynthesis
MDRHLFSRLLMLGPARGARGSIVAAVQAYREQGLFRRWPIDYVPHGFGALHRLGAALVRHGPVVLHVHAGTRREFWSSVPLMAFGLAARCPLLLHLHGGDFRSFYEGASAPSRALIGFFLERATAVLASCDAMRAWLHGVARRAEVACVPAPVMVQGATAPAGRENIVLFMGRLEPHKGVFDLMDAVAALRAEVPDLRLVFAGEGRRRALAKYAKHLGIGECVKVTGWLGPSAKRALFEAAAVYARPSYEDGLPLSLLEAMAARVPVVASAVGGIPEVVVNEVSGLLLAPGDTASLQRRLRRLIKEPLVSARLGKAAHESVRLRFAPERMVARIEEVYAGIGLCAHAEPGGREAGMREAA